MNDIEKVILLAQNEIGITEDANGRVKYSDEYGLPGQPWCMMFLWWLYWKCGMSDIFYGGNKTASCGALWRWAVKMGYTVGSPKRGDIVILSFRKLKDGSRETSHCGIITGENLTNINTIEGNTCEYGSQDNGGHVMAQNRNKRLVYGYIRLPYKNTNAETFIYTVQKNDTLWKIASRFYGSGFKYKKIMEDNKLSSTTIYPGQLLTIYGGN